MSLLVYTPDQDIKVHEEGAIRLICRAFQSHESGLPEWLKNSADAYGRENTEQDRRVIVVIFRYGKGKPASISCLDLVGMTSRMIEEDFRIWADPEAARRGAKAAATGLQGGHGNGGKCYMTHMFDQHAILQTVRGGKGCKYGVVGGSIRFGYIPDRAQGRDSAVSAPRAELSNFVTELGCSLRDLPKPVQMAVSMADGFTLVTGVGPKGYEQKIPVQHLVDNLENHPQMIRTLEFCKVFVVVNGEPFDKGRPLALPDIQPLEGAEKPRILSIPKVLKDPASEEQISTVNGGSLPAGTLILRTSNVSMRYSRKARHNIVYKAQSGYIGFVPVLELDVQSAFRDRIYGECDLDALEPYKQNDRGRLAPSPLRRAVEAFISAQVQAYAREFEARERRKYAQEERDAISKMNEALDRWKNRFLNELMRGLWGAGPDIPQSHPPLPAGKPSRLELALSHSGAGVGVSFRPTLRFFDETGRRIRPIPFRWVSEDNNVAMVDEDLMVINTFAPGRTTIYAATVAGALASNKVPLQVLRMKEIRIVPNQLELPVGSRQKLEAVCRLVGGEETSDVYMEWTESNPTVAKVSSAGMVFGFAPGETQVTCGDDTCLAAEPAHVKVVPGGDGRGKGDRPGRGYPLVLVSGEVDPDPQTKEYVNFSSEDPPIAQRPQDVDRNIWWINSAAPLGQLYLDKSKGYGYESREWRMYHLERYIDVIVQIALMHGPGEKESLSAGEWIIQWGAKAAEIQAAAAADLSLFLATGELPVG